MTPTTIFPARISLATNVSWRVVTLIGLALACLIYAYWRRTVPPGPMPARDVDQDTMRLISRIGLPCQS